MTTDPDPSRKDSKKRKRANGNGVMGSTYGLAFIGALVYYLQHAATFWEGVLGICKAFIWPALLVYKLLESLKM